MAIGAAARGAAAARDGRGRSRVAGPRRLTCLAVAALLVATASARADEVTTGSIAGRVADAAGAPLPGARVTVTSAEGARACVADGEGRFLAAYLTPGVYDVRVELAGFAAAERRAVEVRLGRRVELAFTLAAGAFSAAVEVSAAAPIVDFSAANASTGVKASFLATVPVARRLSDIVYLAPGVSSGGGTGTANPSVSGASGLENVYVMDGVTVNEPRYGSLGLYSKSYGSLGLGVTYELIDEIQVRTAGFDAEFGQSSGGLVNVVTKSGSNVWRGSAFAYLRAASLEGDRTLVTLANGAVNTDASSNREVGFALGGPVVRDRAFFFVALDPQRETTTFLAPVGFPLHALGGVDRVRDTTTYAAKATAALGPDHRLAVALLGDPAHSPVAPQIATAMLSDTTGAFSELSYATDTQTIHYQGVLAQPWLLEASVGRAHERYEDTPALDAWSVTDQSVKPTKRSGGKGSYDASTEGTSMQYEVKSTHLVGDHEIRAGGTWQSTDMANFPAYTGPSVTLPNGEMTTSGVNVTVYPDSTYGKIYRVTSGLLFDGQRSNVGYLGLFLQDRVQLGPRLTVSAGVRYESERMAGSAQAFTFGGNWAPRVGFALDPTGGGALKVFGSFGVFYSRMPSDLAVTAFSPGGRVSRADYYDAALTQPVPDGVAAAGTTLHFLTKGANLEVVDPDARLGFMREAALGAEFQAAADLALGVRYVHRETPRVLEDVSTAAMVLYLLRVPGLSNVQYVLTNPRAGYPATLNGVGAFEDPIRRYDAVELTLDKRFADGWALLASYRWSRLWGTFEGFYNNAQSQAKPGETTFDDYPTNDPSYTQIGVPQFGFTGDIRYLGKLGAGPLPNDRTHQVKAYASYSFAGGLDLGAGFSLASGQPLTPMTTDPVTGYVGYIPLGPRGSGMMTEDGFKTRTAYLWSLDVHAGYPFRLGSGRLLVLADVTNVLNRQAVASYDQNTQRAFNLPNPDFGRRTSYQDPRMVRLGLRYEF